MSRRWIFGAALILALVVVVGILWQVRADPAEPAKPQPRPAAPMHAPDQNSDSEPHDVGPSLYA